MAGLYAPYWDAYTTGTIIGISQFSRKCHLVRATLEGVAFQTNDILSLMNTTTNHGIRIDGGMSSNNVLCQILANITGSRVLRSKMTESTSFGAAMVAGFYFGLWDSFGKTIPTIDADRMHFGSVNSLDRNANSIKANGQIEQAQESNRESSKGYLSKFLYRSYSILTSCESEPPEDDNEELSLEELENYDLFKPDLNEEIRLERITTWHAAVNRSLKWIHLEHEEKKKNDYLRLSTLPIAIYLLSTFAITILSLKS